MKFVFAEFPETKDRDMSTEIALLPEGSEVGVAVYDENDLESYYKALEDADAICSGFAPLDRACIDRLKNCKIISVQATGYNFVDYDYCREKGISVCAIGEYCTQEVADHTMMLILALEKRLPYIQRRVNIEKEWEIETIQTLGMQSIWGQTLGIIGFGKIGRATALRAKAFGMNVIANDPYIDPQWFKVLGVEQVTVDEILARSDVISLHMNLTRENTCMIRKEHFQRMEKKPFFINTARGGLVDEQAMFEALDEGLVMGIGLDVLTSETPDLNEIPIVGRENVIITPHSAFYSDTSIEACERISAENMVYYLNGQPEKAFKIVNGVYGK